MLLADNSAHVVKDDITGITAYVSYKGYTSDVSLLASVSAETIVMERTKEDGNVVMSVCTPDLGITQKGYTTTQPSQVIVKEVVLNGSWKAAQPGGNVRVSTEGGRTMVSVDCINGQPVEFVLTRN